MGERTDYVTYVHQVYDYLHTIPEKGFEEFKTSAFVLEELKKIGFEDIKTGVAGTGIIVTIDSGKEGPVLGLRADMDALEFIIDGKKTMIHACGHDGHTSMLLAAAREIHDRDLVKKGKLKIIFQPACWTTWRRSWACTCVPSRTAAWARPSRPCTTAPAALWNSPSRELPATAPSPTWA